jgi:hypothetical protein
MTQVFLDDDLLFFLVPVLMPPSRIPNEKSWFKDAK